MSKTEEAIKEDFREYLGEKLKDRTISAAQLNQQNRILYATFGFHNGERFDSIIERKLQEIDTEGFGLWGTGNISEEGIKNIRDYCRAIEDHGQPVYLFLKYTGSKAQEHAEKEIYYTHFMDEKDEKKPLKGIVVKGSSRQDLAFVVDNYYLYDSSFSLEGLYESYERKSFLYNSLSANAGNQLSCKFFEKKADITEADREHSELAIILKLKCPYIVNLVQCV